MGLRPLPMCGLYSPVSPGSLSAPFPDSQFALIPSQETQSLEYVWPAADVQELPGALGSCQPPCYGFAAAPASLPWLPACFHSPESLLCLWSSESLYFIIFPMLLLFIEYELVCSLFSVVPGLHPSTSLKIGPSFPS